MLNHLKTRKCAILSDMKIALKITPPRSTQYARMTAQLARPELLTSPLGDILHDIQHITLAGQPYLHADMAGHAIELPQMQEVLGHLGATSEAYEYFAQVGDREGPFLRPIEPLFTPFVPVEMAEVRRYRGKTNEIFTRVLLNVALFAGEYRTRYTERVRILDPFCGGGTTLVLA